MSIHFKVFFTYFLTFLFLIVFIIPIVQAGSPPFVDITSYASIYPYPEVSGTTTITGTVTDSDGIDTIDTLTVAIGPVYPLNEYLVGPLSPTGIANWSYKWDTTTLDDGEYRITAYVSDIDGFEYYTYVNVTVSNTGIKPGNKAPRATIWIRNWEILSGIVESNGHGRDEDTDGTDKTEVKFAEVRIDDGEWFSPNYWIDKYANFYWDYWFDSRLLEDGWHSMSVRVHDGNTYSPIESLWFMCDNDPTTSPKGVTWGGGLEIVDDVWGASLIEDLDRDGDFDILSGNVHSHQRFYKNIGNVREPLWAASYYQMPERRSDQNPSSVQDLDGDGILDLIFFNRVNNHMEFHLNKGTPASPFWTTNITLPIPGINNFEDTPLSFNDIDNDDDPDLFVYKNGVLWFFRNTGFNTTPILIEENDFVRNFPTEHGYNFEVADLNGDNLPDLTFLDRDWEIPADLHHYMNIGDIDAPKWQRSLTMFDGINEHFLMVRFRDIDWDGDKDLIFHGKRNKLEMFFNTGNSTVAIWTKQETVLDGIHSHNSNQPVLVDFDNDGDVDLLNPGCPDEDCRPVEYQYYENSGNSSSPHYDLDPIMTSSLPKPINDEIRDIAFGDLDDDGLLDLVILWKNTRSYPDYGHGFNLSLFVNIGNISRPIWSEREMEYPRILQKGGRVGLLDLDEDGDLDLFVHANGYSSFRNIGTKTSFKWEMTPNRIDTIPRLDYVDIDRAGGVEPVEWGGTEYGFGRMWDNISHSQGLHDNRFFHGHTFGDRVKFTTVDFDGDGDKDLVMNNYYHILKVVYNLGFRFMGPTFSPMGSTVDVNEAIRFEIKAIDPTLLNDTFEYLWEFGDGSSSSWSAEPVIEHTYDVKGTCIPVLKYRKVDNQSNITVLSLGKIRILKRTLPPKALMEDINTVIVGIPIKLSATPSYDQDGEIIKYHWELYWRGNSTEKEFTITFWDSGNLRILLTVWDNEGLNDTCYRVFQIKDNSDIGPLPRPTSKITGPKKGKVNETLTFKAVVDSEPGDSVWQKSFSWDFGDGSTGNGPITYHTFEQKGNYNVTLIVTDNLGRDNEDIKKVVISVDGPISDPEKEGSGTTIKNIYMFLIAIILVIIIIVSMDLLYQKKKNHMKKKKNIKRRRIQKNLSKETRKGKR